MSIRTAWNTFICACLVINVTGSFAHGNGKAGFAWVVALANFIVVIILDSQVRELRAMNKSLSSGKANHDSRI